MYLHKCFAVVRPVLPLHLLMTMLGKLAWYPVVSVPVNTQRFRFQNTTRGGILRRTVCSHVFALTSVRCHVRQISQQLFNSYHACRLFIVSSFFVFLAPWWCYEICITRNMRKSDVLLSVEFSGDSRGKTDKRSWDVFAEIDKRQSRYQTMICRRHW